MYRRPKNTYLWLLALSVFIPLSALAQQGTPPATTATVAPLPISQMTPAEREARLKAYKAEQERLRGEAVKAANSAPMDSTTAAELQKLVDADKATVATETAQKEAEKNAPKAVSRISSDIKEWKDLKTLIPDIKFVVDRAKGASGDKDYATSVHLEGSIPKKCEALIGNGNELVARYDGTQKIDSLSKLDIPFRGYNFKTSDAAQACVDQFVHDRKDKKNSGYCKTDKFPDGEPCTFVRDVTRIDSLAGGPKIGFYSCEGDGSDCKVDFYPDGKSESDIKRIADGSVYDLAKKKVDISLNGRKTNLALWKVKNDCYGFGKKSGGLDTLLSEVAALKGKLKDKEDLSPYVKKGLNNEIKRFRAEAQSLIDKNKTSELPALGDQIVAFYQKYLNTTRPDVLNPDLDTMRRDTLAIFRVMERGVLDSDSALKNPDTAKSNAEAIISQALVLSPDDLALKNELDQGIKIDVTVLKMERKDVALANLVKQCRSNPQGCDGVRLNSMISSRFKSSQQAAQYYEKLKIAAYKACATGSRKRGSTADPFDDEGLVVGGGDDDVEDTVTFTSRCDAAKDNLNRVWRRVQDSNDAAQAAGGPNPQMIAQIAQGITGGNALPNATIQPGQAGYNPALAYALNPKQFPGDFTPEFLKSLAPQLVPTTMCLSGTGQTLCPNTQQVPGIQPTVVQGTMPAQLPVVPRV